jgi:hypothetical protein
MVGVRWITFWRANAGETLSTLPAKWQRRILMLGNQVVWGMSDEVGSIDRGTGFPTRLAASTSSWSRIGAHKSVILASLADLHRQAKCASCGRAFYKEEE